MPKPPITVDRPGKFKPTEFTNPEVDGIVITGTFDQYDLSGGRKVKDQSFAGDGTSQWVILGAGNDTAQMGGASDIAQGGAGDDTLNGGGGDDYLFGGENDDVLNGGDGGDLIEGGDGDDLIEGGDGADMLDGGTHGAGGDTLSYAGSDAGVSVNLATNVASGGDAEGDTISGFENLIGSDYNDALFGNNIEGSVTFILGGGGGDYISTRQGSVTADGGDGNDTLLGGNLAQTLIGGEGEDLILGSRGADLVDLTEANAATDTVAYGGGAEGIDQVTGFNTDALAAGGDRIRVDFGTADDPASLQESVDEGLTLITNVGGFVQLSFDIGDDNDSANNAGLLLTDVAWPGGEADVIALLADNFAFI